MKNLIGINLVEEQVRHIFWYKQIFRFFSCLSYHATSPTLLSAKTWWELGIYAELEQKPNSLFLYLAIPKVSNFRQFRFSVISPSSSWTLRPSGIVSPGRCLAMRPPLLLSGALLPSSHLPPQLRARLSSRGTEVAPASVRRDEWSFVTAPEEGQQRLSACTGFSSQGGRKCVPLGGCSFSA